MRTIIQSGRWVVAPRLAEDDLLDEAPPLETSHENDQQPDPDLAKALFFAEQDGWALDGFHVNLACL